MEESGAEVWGERENEGKTFDSRRQLEFIFQFTYHWVVGEGEAKKAACRQRDTRKKWPKRRTGGRNSFKYQGHLKLRLSKPKLSFLHYPLSSSNYFENYSQANHKHFNGLCLDDMYVSCTCFHQNKQTNKGKNQRNSFPHKAQDKINPIYIFKAKMSVFLAFVSFAITCL